MAFRAPFRTIERNPVYRTSHTPAAEPGDVVPAGRLEFAAATTYSNILEWMLGDALYAVMDTERWVNQAELRYGFAEGWEAGVRVSSRTDWGGFLDPFVQWWHARIGLPNGDREKVEDNDYAMFIDRESERLFHTPSGTRLEDPVLLMGRRLWNGGEAGALTARLTGKVPLGASATGTGKADVGLQLDGRRSWTRWHLFGGLGWATMSAPQGMGPFAENAVWLAHLAVERDFGPLSAQVQLQRTSSWLSGVGNQELDRTPVNLAVGATFDLAGLRWEAAFVEDVRPNSPAVDFTLDIRVRKTLGS